MRVELRQAHWQTVRVGVVLVVQRHPLFLQFGGPRCHRKAARNVRAHLPECGDGWRVRIRGRRGRRSGGGPVASQAGELWWIEGAFAPEADPVAGEVRLAVCRPGGRSVHPDALLRVARNARRQILRPLCGNRRRTQRDDDGHPCERAFHVDLLSAANTLSATTA
jgi:hypothetical protein